MDQNSARAVIRMRPLVQEPRCRVRRQGIVRKVGFVAFVLTLMMLFVTACARAASPPATGSPTPAGGTTVQVWQLRYLLLGHYIEFAYCDPDLFPVAHGDELAAADDWWSHANRSSPEIGAILAHRSLREPLTADQQLSAYRDHKRLNVIAMTAVPAGYDYELPTSASGGGEPDQTILGLISSDGVIHERLRSPRPGGCPICLEASTRIATPHGEVLVVDIKPGDLVWSVDASGHRIAVPVERIAQRATPGPHLMLRVALSDGRALIAASAHPAANGTYLGALRTAQPYDGATIASIGWVPSTAPATHDLLPGGPTGNYWANGILIGSTLNR